MAVYSSRKPARPYCCVCAEFDGIPPEVHAAVCREPRDADALFDLPDQTKEGGQHL